MLKKLRLKIILAIVLVAAVMLGAILGLFYTLTKQNLRTQSISMMQAIAADPFAPVQPEREPQQVRLPYFVLQTDAFGNLVAIGSSDYDLTDRTFLRMVAAAAQASRDAIGEIPEYSLRYCRVTGSVIFADISSEQQTLRTLLKTGALLVALGLLAFFGLAVLLARSAVRPVEEAWRQQKQFVADASHELKTPLQGIIGSAELLENGMVKPEDMPRFVGHIRAEAQRLVTLIGDIIRLSELDEGGELPTETVDLLPLAQEAAENLRAAAEAKNVSIIVSGENAPVIGVRRLLYEIAYNLCDNAIKYNADGGSVDVRVGAEGGSACLTVRDTGIGIPPEHQSRIFERFYRVDKSHSKASGGTGLGLSIVKHAVAYHHGTIALKSEVGKGTEIAVRFPQEK